MKRRKKRVPREIGYQDCTGTPEGLPRAFVAFIIEYAGCRYGHWWYVQKDGTKSRMQGSYIWLEWRKMLGVSHHGRTLWATVDDFEAAFIAIANDLLT